MTMMDSLGESNWIPMTRNTRKMADSRAVLTLWVASSVVESSDPVPTATPSGRVRPRTALSMALAAVYLAVSVVVAVTVTLYCPSCRVMLGRVVMYSTSAMSRRVTIRPLWVAMG